MDENTMNALVLAEVIATAKFLPVVGPLERLVVCVKGAVVTLEVFKATRAKSGSDARGVPDDGKTQSKVLLLAECAAALYWVETPKRQ
jgi:hypothetical protein